MASAHFVASCLRAQVEASGRAVILERCHERQQVISKGKAMSQFQQGPRSTDRFRRLSLEQLEPRSVPSAVTFRVASEIVRSQEGLTNFVTAEYRVFLLRSPDTAGLNFFVNQLRSGVAPEVVDAEFVSSTEYIRLHGGVGGGWVPALYTDLLGRVPSGAEINFWALAVARGASTFQVGLAFSTSIERDILKVTTDYVQLLGRVPDTPGLNFFVNALRVGVTQFDVETSIIGSTEYFLDHGNTNAGFVIGAFQNVLGRTPSNPEISFFVQQLNTL
jgi:hypothetical protein